MQYLKDTYKIQIGGTKTNIKETLEYHIPLFSYNRCIIEDKN